MSYAIFVAMIMTMVACDAVPTHPNDEIHKVHLGEWSESACEDESFDPWNAGEEHRPLGVVNRLRKVIYPIVSDYRHCLNYPDRAGCKGKIEGE